jgi:hypothetical protein
MPCARTCGERGPAIPLRVKPRRRSSLFRDAVMRFRDFLRHAYVVDLDAARLSATTARLERAVALTESWLEAVLSGLTNGPAT